MSSFVYVATGDPVLAREVGFLIWMTQSNETITKGKK
jgi:hypothetical protein